MTLSSKLRQRTYNTSAQQKGKKR